MLRERDFQRHNQGPLPMHLAPSQKPRNNCCLDIVQPHSKCFAAFRYCVYVGARRRLSVPLLEAAQAKHLQEITKKQRTPFMPARHVEIKSSSVIPSCLMATIPTISVELLALITYSHAIIF